MRTCIYAALLITIESSAFAGTLYPDTPYYTGGKETLPAPPGDWFVDESIQITANLPAMLSSTATNWSASLMVYIVDTFDAQGTNGDYLTSDEKALTLDGGWYGVLPAEPISGLPNGFHVEAVSTDYKWVTDGMQLYHVPSPTSGALAMVMLLCLPLVRRLLQSVPVRNV